MWHILLLPFHTYSTERKLCVDVEPVSEIFINLWLNMPKIKQFEFNFHFSREKMSSVLVFCSCFSFFYSIKCKWMPQSSHYNRYRISVADSIWDKKRVFGIDFLQSASRVWDVPVSRGSPVKLSEVLCLDGYRFLNKGTEYKRQYDKWPPMKQKALFF